MSGAARDWSAAEWAGPAAARDKELLDWLQEQYKAATTHHKDFSCQGPVFDRDGTLAHWGHRQNFFTADVRTMSKMQQLVDKNDENRPITLFYFDSLHMDEGDDPPWTVKLGDYVTIIEEKMNEAGEEVEDLYVARLDEIVYTVTGERRITVQWMYRIQDTALAEPVKVAGAAARTRGAKQAENVPDPLMVLPVGGDDFARQRLWLCGSSEDNRRYDYSYKIENIGDPVNVFFVPPGCETPEHVKQLHPTFDKGDFFYNGYTKQDFHTFEDLLVDVTPWSPLYRKVWEEHGVAGIRKLRGDLSLEDPDGGFKRLMSLSRGAQELGWELGMPEDLSVPASSTDGAPRTLQKLELFAGGGGLSYMAQEMEGCGSIVSCWANDINASACATYACNRPYTFVSCCGLEELLQLFKKHHAATFKWLGPGWQELDEMKPLLDLPPGKRYSRQHMPEGVGCGGGRNQDDAMPFIHSARQGQKARQRQLAVLLRLAKLGSPEEVKQELARLQGSADTQPITDADAEFVYKQAQHAKQFKQLQQAKEESLPTPDFDACRAALPRVRLLPADFDSSSGSAEQRAERLLEAVLPRQPSDDHFAAVAAQKQQAQPTQQQQKKASKAPKAAGAGSSASASYKQAVRVAYEKAWREQLAALEENLELIEEEGLGKVLEVRDVRIRDCAVRVKQGSSAKQTEGALTSYECWLEFEVKRTGGEGESWHWEHEALMHLDDAIPAMQQFLLTMVADKTIPLPGDVDVMTGGPPCQNMSGLNRQARQEDVLNDPKNRLVACYMGTIEHLQPGYLLIEQVTDIYKKEDAKYARFTLVTMLQHGYQTRAGILTAGNYGAPQGRQRAIFWGARSGVEQLPSFPAATHQCKQHGIGNPEGCKFGIVEALPAGSKVGGVTVKPLYPFHVWGDVTSDLPAVDNYSEIERQGYTSAPQTFLQQWLRRTPPAHELPVLMRGAHADAAMEAFGSLFDREEADKALAGEDAVTTVAAGQLAICQTSKWLSSLTVEQARKLAAARAKEAARAARAAASGSAGGEEEEGEDQQQQQGNDGCLDEDLEDAAEAAELKTLMGEERDFTRNVQRQRLLSGGDEDEAEEILLFAQTQQHNITQFTGVRRLQELDRAHKADSLLGPLRDQRPHQCNMDDSMRMEALPKGRGVGFRDWDGVVTNADQTCCAGSWHAAAKEDKGETAKVKARVQAYKALPAAEMEKTDPVKYVYDGIRLVSGCAGGGNDPKPPPGLLGASGNDTKYRVDSYGRAQVKGTHKEGCASQTYFIASNGLLCPRWCVTYKGGTSIGRNGCFGRIHPDIIQPTVVTRPEPHNLQLVHDEEPRVLTVRENSRCQAFPDFHVFVGLEGGMKSGSGKGVRIVAERYLQIGNAVAPPMAAGLGRCLLLAAAKKAPVAEPVIYSPDPEWEQAVEKGKAAGCVAYSKANNVPQEAPDNWERHPHAAGKGARKRAAAEASGAQQQQQQPGDTDAAESDAAAAGPEEPAPKRQRGGSSKKGKARAAAAAAVSPPKGAKKTTSKQQPDEQSAEAEAAAAAGDATQEAESALTPQRKQKKEKKKPKRPLAAAAAAAECGSPDAGSGDAARKTQRQQKKQKTQQLQSPAAAAAAAAGGADAGAGASTQADNDADITDIAVVDSDQAAHKSPARRGSGGKVRPQRAQAAAAAVAIRESLQKESAKLL